MRLHRINLMRARAAALLVLAGQAVGCARTRPFDELWVRARPYQAELAAARPPESVFDRGVDTASEPASHADPVGELTLRDAVALALRRNPGLRAAGWSVTAAEADAVQMGRPPNPRLSIGVENIGATANDKTFESQTLLLSQVIELGGKRLKRLRLGEATQRLRAWDYEQQRLAVAAEAASGYVAVLVSQERVELARQQLELAEAGYRIADDRARAGTAPGQQRDQAAARVALSRIALERARQRLVSDRADLVASWGGASALFDRAVGGLDRRVDLPEMQTLEAALAQSPALARWSDEISQRQRAWVLQKANARADPTVGAGVKYLANADDVAGVVELSFPLTVLNDNEHGILAARLRIAEAYALQDQARAHAGQALARALARYRSAEFALQAFDEQALPASESAYRAALDAYQAGLTDYLTVLEAERTLLDTRNGRLDAVLAYHQAAIEIERITAEPLAPKTDDDVAPAPG